MVAAIGFALGWNDAGGVRYHSNIVPFLIFAGLALLCFSGTVALTRGKLTLPVSSGTVAVAALAVISWGVAAMYARYVVPLIKVRADVVMGSESQFVDHIIRYRAGQPQYTPAEDANTSAYSPGAPLLTYLIASAAGMPTSIPAYRAVQQLFLLVAVVFATLAARNLFRYCRPGSQLDKRWLWFWVPFFYLISNNPYTNVYTHVLYSDALGLMAEAVAFWILVKHFTTGDDRWLAAMVVVPSLGFLAKQKQAIWVVLYFIYLLLSGRTSLRRTVLMTAVSAALLAATIGVCYALWGAPFYFWTFAALSRLHVSLREVFEQIMQSGWYTALGLIGGILLLRGAGLRRLLPLWLCWCLEVLASFYTSGIAFFPAHLGPATLVGAVWFAVGLSTLWPEGQAQEGEETAMWWWRAAVVPAGVLLFFISSGIVRTGSQVPPGLERYLQEIEKEFDGSQRDRVLLDTGSWVYLPDNVVMKDRESPLGTLWGTGASDFAATVGRIREQHYEKILMRKARPGQYEFRVPRIYDALREHYREVRVIRSPGIPEGWLYPPLLYDVSVLEPVRDAQAMAGTDRPPPSPPKQVSDQVR